MASNTQTIDDAMAAIPPNYRFYTVDGSIEGRYRAILTLTGQDREDWHAMGKVRDHTGKDVRPDLYLVGTGRTMAEAITEAARNAR